MKKYRMKQWLGGLEEHYEEYHESFEGDLEAFFDHIKTDIETGDILKGCDVVFKTATSFQINSHHLITNTQYTLNVALVEEEKSLT